MMKLRYSIQMAQEHLKSKNIDWYIVPTSDCHNSEYVDEHFKTREWLSGFTGSNGTLLIGKGWAGLWTDGRYFIQAQKELEDSEIELMKMGQKGVPSIGEFLKSNIKAGETLGFDGRTCSKNYIDNIISKLDVKLAYQEDEMGHLWDGRPEMSCNRISVLSTEYCGSTVLDKLEYVRNAMAAADCKYHLITKLDDIMWLFNIRGKDIDYNPVAYSYAFITEKDVFLFVQRGAVSAELSLYARINNIVLMDYDVIFEFLDHFDYDTGSYRDEENSLDVSEENKNISTNRVLIDEYEVNYICAQIINSHAVVRNAVNPTTMFKTVKNETEIENMYKFFLADSVAMTKFLYWIDTTDKNGLSECSAAEYIDTLRDGVEEFNGLSFPTISAYGANGAIVHYEPQLGKDAKLDNKGMLLVDSGGQYPGATTDVTRTLILGEISDEEKHDFTLVAKGWLALMYAVFPEGCTGRNLDILARDALWKEGKDYNHGTGHGVGCFLNVHEGPVNIRYKYNRNITETVLEPGMVVTDEPGIYIEGKYGIRTENTLLVVEDKDHEGFMRFEPLTLVPLDMRGIDMNIMNIDDAYRLAVYQKKVYDSVAPFLNEDERKWLADYIQAK